MLDPVSQTAEATYEGDVLRLHQPLPLDQRQRVWVVVVPASELPFLSHEIPSPDDILQLAAQVYEGLSPAEVDEIGRLALDRRRFFTRQE